LGRVVRHFQRQARFSRGTAAEWTAENPVLFKGEPGLETDTRKVKMGDGSTAWNSLSYWFDPSVSGVSDHGDLTGLSDDDHTAYATNVELTAHLDDTSSVHDHGSLSGLADDDHSQYALDTDLTTHAGAADPHAGYRLESADHTHASSGAEGGTIDHGAITGLTDDDHTQYLKEADFDDIDFLVGTATGHTGAEIVVGTSPGGELGGTWGSPTVDATHSGSTHSTATDAHIADTGDAHDASAISVDSTTLAGVGTDVQAVLEELDDAIAAGGVTSIEANGEGALTGDVTFSEGTGITLNTSGNDIEINSTGSGVAAEDVTVDNSGFEELAGADGQTVFEEVDSILQQALAALEDTEVAIDEHLAAADPHVQYADVTEPIAVAHRDDTTNVHDHGQLAGLTDDDHTQYTLTTELDAVRGVDFLVGTATGELSGEIVAGTAPGGELGGTWGSPTVDATHSGSTHSAATDTHIADTDDAHDASAISVDSTDLVGTGTEVQTVVEELDDAIVAVDQLIDDHIADAADAHDASAISIADAGNDFTATTVEGALDELQADNEAHVAAADPHTGYVLESLLDAAGDIYIASAADTPARLARGTDDQVLRSTGATVAWESPPFSISVLLDGAGSTLAEGFYPIWNASFPCTVTAVKAYADTGTTTVVNAGTGVAGAENFCSADITIDPADAWESGTVDGNQAVAAGETVSVEVVTDGTATRVTIQIDFTRP